ncbi:helix-turn-helix domain-containing protein [Janthinobacterium fluminis]|uniref:Helix-turn-helix domain-containing protein n=1 Tax=Janthinobacterium fluminis TaxID=2987524 RepID=A0ABT5K788_9BURK|nr:helix-turn-helix domain-containing protein [Janthinobacterium fluminis]MDC8760656.1 helix-turn-helix domain-containing protein [Janthinobacterium fluminis]
MSASIPALPSTRLIAPRLSLAACARAYLARSSMACAPLTPQQRLNRFPASPLCSISWMVAGEAEMVVPMPGAVVPVPAMLFGGPQSRPTVSYNPGPMHGFMLLLYPAALHKLTGLDISAWVDRFAPVEEALGPDWAAMARQALAAPDDAARVALIEAFLEPRWLAARAEDDGRGGIVGDWVKRLGVQVAAAGWGRGARNLERRVKAWAGQPMRTLRRMSRAEQSFLSWRAAKLEGRASWADIAARGGYADQAHLCRETKEITGLSPTELLRAGQEDESYWVYRIWS